ncbi:MAG: MerR family transcriptional regulator [Hyphomicrobiales bacterium]
MTNDPLLTAAECARRLGLTTKALRVYETRGLIEPRRTEKNWRLYGSREIARLHEILMLQQLGLTLSHIGEMLAGRRTDLAAVLALQEETLRGRQARIDRSLSLVRSLQSKHAGGEGLSLDDMITLAKETAMTQTATDPVAWKRYEQSRPRTAVAIDPALLTDYAGSYCMTDGSTVGVLVRGKELYLQLLGQPDVLFQAEGKDAFFTTVVAAQVSFQRDQDGKVSALMLHQNGHDMPAERVGDGAFAASRHALEERIAGKTPYPDSESVLREVIDQHVRGAIDYDRMTAPLADVARSQADLIEAEMERLGQPGLIQFKGVDGLGYDIYEVQFANGRTEWGLSLSSDGRINGLYTRNAV